MTLRRRAVAAARRLHRSYLLRHQLRLTTWWRFGRRHAAEIDPFRNLWVDPATIDTYIDMEREDYLEMRHDFGVFGGDWDLAVTPLVENFVFDSIQAHFVGGVPWERTQIHRVAMEGIQRGIPRYHGCRTNADLEQRLQQLERLHETVRSHGYLTQRQLDRSDGDHPLRRRPSRPPQLDEIIVHIGRHGNLIFVDGIHRLSVAKVLALPTVPVCVLYRHEAWQAHRDRVVRERATLPASTFRHPDLAYLQGPRPTG